MKKIVSILVGVALLVACGESVNETLSSNPGFAEYISAHTSGVISKKSSIRIQLTESVDGVDLTKPIKDDLFVFQPSITGKTVWVDNRTIEFVPSQNLEGNTKYIVNFNLGKLKKTVKELKKFVFEFSTIKQNYAINILGLGTYDENDLSKQYLEGTISFADAVDSNNIKKALSVSQGSTKLPLSLRLLSDKEYRFIADKVNREKTKDTELKLTFVGEAVGVEGNIEKYVDVYSQNSFKITETQVIQFPDQYINIHFSSPLKRKQALAGMVTVKGVNSLNYSVDGHNLKVYLPYQVTGLRVVEVHQGIESSNGGKLKNEYEKELSFEALKPDVRLASDGVIMPSTHGLKFPFEAVNLKAVDVFVTRIYENNLAQFLQVNSLSGSYQLKRVGKEIFQKKINLTKAGTNLNVWNKYTIDLAEIIGEDEGALYQVELKFKKEYSNYGCENASDLMEELPEVEIEKDWSESDWDSYGYDYDYYDYYDEDYDYREDDNPCNSAYYRDKGVTTNFLVSDIGLIAKAGADKVLHIFANDIKTTAPLSAIKIDIYNYQQQVIGTVSTDGDGMASISLEEKPFMILAKSNKQRAYLKLNDGEALSLSKFDVSGATVQRGVKGFIYGERGVWRPGDSLFLTFIMEDKESVLPTGHPIEFKFYNPRNQLVTRKITSLNSLGFYDFRTVTSADAPTGNYRAQVKIGSRNFTKYIKVETVKPNRLKIKLTATEELLTKGGSNQLSIDVKWLHGAIAGGLKTKIDVSVDQAGTSFDKFKGYRFDDPTKRFYSKNLTVFNSTLNTEGQAEIPLNLNINSAAPGMLNVHFTTKVFEKGGGFSIDRKSFKYSPYNSYVGVKVPKGDMYAGTLETGKKHRVEVANVTELGKPLSSDVEVRVYKISWRWWWDNYNGKLASYISRSENTPLFIKEISTSNGKGNFDMEFKEWGRYLIYVKDLNSGHSTGQIFYADEPYWSRSNRTDNEFATMLAFSTDKESYEVGDEVKVTFPSGENGRALVSIESGSKIITKEWIKTVKGATKHSFTVTEEMAPNVFVHITLLQPHENTKNDLPIRMYGIVPIKVENKDSHLEPVISMPDVLRPETTATIKINEKEGKPMTYTLAVVDEGLLDLTSYKTPNPWGIFYAHEALGVKTWDLYDYIMNAYSLEMDKVLAVGGGGEINGDKKSAKANRFKPMVRFIGPFNLEKGTATHKIDIPNYVGSVRVMVVAGKKLRYGSAEKTVKINKPLMVLGTLPRVVGPQEEIALPVNVFASEAQVKDVKIKVKVNDMFVLYGDEQSITFNEIGDQVVNFKLTAANKIGIGKVEIIATSGNLTATDVIELDVRPANPLVTDVTETVLQAGEEWNNDFAFKGVEGTNKATIEISSIPPLNLEKRLRYLVRYPHGCIEQTTSSVFPQLYLSSLMELTDSKKAEIETNIEAALKRLTKFQTGSGGFAYWPGQVEESEWGTNYGAHFLIEAEKKGYSLPFGMKDKLMSYMKKQARVWKKASTNNTNYSSYSNNDLIQSYRLYVLALANNPEQGAMNRLRETTGLSLTAKWRLAGAYQLLKQTTVAKKLIGTSSTTVSLYSEMSYSYGSGDRDEAMILEVLSLMDDKAKAAMVAKKVASALSDQRWMSTQTTAYCLIAMSKFVGTATTSKDMKFTYTFNGKGAKTKKTSMPLFQDFIKGFGTDGGSVNVKNSGKGLIYVRLLTEGIPAIGEGVKTASNLQMSVSYMNMDGSSLIPINIKQGSDFKVKVRVYNPGIKGHLSEMALTQIFPSGWEIHNTRMDEHSSNNNDSYFDYQDIRDDRVNTYFSLRKGESKVFTVQLNATYLGKFYMPTILCEAMYDHSVSAREPGKWVEVVK
jgi:uncharacterized protein YfaS (alpha-2-macroglobulin family)